LDDLIYDVIHAAADVYCQGHRFLCATMIMRQERTWSVDLHCNMISKIYGHFHRALRESDLGMRMILFFGEGDRDMSRYRRSSPVTLNYSFPALRVPFYCGFL